MDKINWANYNYDEFELFCNALLSFEMGKAYQPFSAPGRDGGIDGAFSGDYNGHVGKWRFQFKFFLAARSEAVSNLKSQIKKEAEKLIDEDYFVLVTNVELLPQEVNSIMNAFNVQVQVANKSCIIFIWEGAKLFNLFIQYPILSFWLNEGFPTAQLQPYRNVYEAKLDIQNFGPSSMSTHFIGREKDLDDLTGFMKSDLQMVVISGEAGIGKTRLALEFFEHWISQSNDWIALVMISRNFNYDKIYRALYPGHNYIVFIDDAHTFDPKIIADMKAIAARLRNVKLILTARNIQASNALSLLKEYEHNHLLRITLSELSRSETKEVFTKSISHTEYRHYIDQLVIISFGKPILIVAMLDAINRRVPINSIKKQYFLKDYVTKYFDAYVDAVKSETGMEKIDIRRLLQAIALLEPFNFNDSETIGKISGLLGLERTPVTAALGFLIEFSYVNGRFEQSIKPDYYSDIILSDIDPNEVVTFLTEFVPLIGNIIINLSSVDEITNNDKHILNVILQIYIKLIKTSDDITIVKKTLSTILNITMIKQNIAKDSIDIYLKCMAINEHPVHIEKEDDKRYNYYASNSAIGLVITILQFLYQSTANADFVYRRGLNLYALTEEKNVIKVFAFDKQDVLKNFDMERQDFFVNEFERKFRKYNALELTFGLQCLKGFAVLDFTLSEWSAINRDSITITTYFLPNNNAVKRFRRRLIELLKKLYRAEEATSIHAEVLKTIIDFPRGIFATNRNSMPYCNDSEIKSVLKFLKSDAATFNLVEQKEILDKLYWFQKWGISEILLPFIFEAKEALKPKNLVERLSQLFSKTEIIFLEMPNIEDYIAQKCQELVETVDKEDLAKAIVAFLEPQTYPPYYYFSFQNTLERQYPEYAKILYHQLYIHSLPLFEMYASRILGTLYFQHHDDIFYWEQVHVLQESDNVSADNVILMVYAQRVPDMTVVREMDTDAIITVFDKGRKENEHYLSMAIQLLFAANHPDALTICHKFLARAEQRQTEMFFIRLSDNKKVSGDQMADLIINHSIKYHLTYEIELCLNRVLISNGIDAVFDYLVKRFDYKKQIVIATRSLTGYEFLPDGQYSHLFDGHLDKKMPMFEKGLNWYLNLDKDGGHLFYAKDMVTYLQPAQSLCSDLVQLYSNLLTTYTEDPERLERVLNTISFFHTKDENLVQLIIDIYPAINDYQDIDPEQYKRLRYQCYNALTMMGVKSGTAGMQFQVDLDLKQLLETVLDSISEIMPSRQFLKDVIKSFDAEIERGSDMENLTW